MGSGERKRCSNMAPVRRLRSLAWMNARRFPGVRCSTLKTECRSLLCLMIMPGRSWVAGIAIAGSDLLADLRPALSVAEGLPGASRWAEGTTDIAAALGLTSAFYTTWPDLGILARRLHRALAA